MAWRAWSYVFRLEGLSVHFGPGGSRTRGRRSANELADLAKRLASQTSVKTGLASQGNVRRRTEAAVWEGATRENTG